METRLFLCGSQNSFDREFSCVRERPKVLNLKFAKMAPRRVTMPAEDSSCAPVEVVGAHMFGSARLQRREDLADS